ncbi:glycosyltransferase family 61 protein [Sphingomonas arenae]|uniref:glycosyltransferase family 61 protein n=1 Tax=Sphingomonas arenae TaxID=2812555 RepID=UPI00196782B4|nr:glycosyltransferase family 61 protein [Sphingomonas arenae]
MRAKSSGLQLSQVASDMWEIAPPVEHGSRPVICLPGEVDRILAHHPDSSPRINLERLHGTPIRQGGAMAYLVPDAVIAHGVVMSPSAYAVIRKEDRRLFLGGRVEEIEEGALCSTYVTERYFGHWLTDGLAHELWAQDQKLDPLVLPSPPVRIHETGYRELTGLRAREVRQAHVRRLWLIEDHELSASRVARVERIRQRIRSEVGPGGPKRVFLSRGRTGVGRVLANEVAIRETLARRGFAILSPEASDPRTIAHTLASAETIVSPEGSAIAHAVMAAPAGCALVVLQPPRQFNMLFKSYADVLGMKFAFAVGDDVDGNSFTQPIERLERLLDMLAT